MTVPDSRMLNIKDGYLQGYNPQPVATEQQFVIAAGHQASQRRPGLRAHDQGRGEQPPHRGRETTGPQGRRGRGLLEHRQRQLQRRGSFIAPGRGRQLKQIAETETQLTGILQRAEAGEVDAFEVSEQLGVTRARVNQLLRRRRGGDPDPLTTTMIVKLDPTRPQDLQDESRNHRSRLRPDQAQPRDPPPLTPWPGRGGQRMEADVRRPHPAQGLPTHLTGPAGLRSSNCAPLGSNLGDMCDSLTATAFSRRRSSITR